MYTDGTSALKKEMYQDTAHSDKSAKIKKLPLNKKRAVNVRLLKKRIVLAMGLVFVMAITVLMRYAIIAKDYGELTKAREELELINAKVVETKVKAEGNLDPKKVEEEAQRLGLQQPTESQMKYVSLGNTDNGEVLKTEEPSALSAFINRMSVILEYIY